MLDASSTGLLYPERQRYGLRFGTFIHGVEVVHLERAADLIAGAILEDRKREQTVRAGAPRLVGRKRPLRLIGANGDVAIDDLAAASHAERTEEKTVIDWFREGDDERRLRASPG
jgi:hypothetical protein